MLEPLEVLGRSKIFGASEVLEAVEVVGLSEILGALKVLEAFVVLNLLKTSEPKDHI